MLLGNLSEKQEKKVKKAVKASTKAVLLLAAQEAQIRELILENAAFYAAKKLRLANRFSKYKLSLLYCEILGALLGQGVNFFKASEEDFEQVTAEEHLLAALDNPQLEPDVKETIKGITNTLKLITEENTLLKAPVSTSLSQMQANSANSPFEQGEENFLYYQNQSFATPNSPTYTASQTSFGQTIVSTSIKPLSSHNVRTSLPERSNTNNRGNVVLSEAQKALAKNLKLALSVEEKPLENLEDYFVSALLDTEGDRSTIEAARKTIRDALRQEHSPLSRAVLDAYRIGLAWLLHSTPRATKTELDDMIKAAFNASFHTIYDEYFGSISFDTQFGEAERIVAKEESKKLFIEKQKHSSAPTIKKVSFLLPGETPPQSSAPSSLTPHDLSMSEEAFRNAFLGKTRTFPTPSAPKKEEETAFFDEQEPLDDSLKKAQEVFDATYAASLAKEEEEAIQQLEGDEALAYRLAMDEATPYQGTLSQRIREDREEKGNQRQEHSYNPFL